MNCKSVKQLLPLYAGGDLSAADADKASAHLQECADCEHFFEGLTANQRLLRSLRQETLAPGALTTMRQELLPRLAATRLGWWVRIERFFLIETRRPRFAIAGVILAVVVSATLFAQLRHVSAFPDKAAAVFESDSLRLPENYRDWVLVGRATEQPHAGNAGAGDVSRNVYMTPVAYREYRRNGVFPEGTVMVLESKAANNGGEVTLEASVKDRRFSEGWGYFRFDRVAGRLATKAQVLSEAVGCVACHRNRGATDHVFTQFYSILKSGSGVQI